MRKIVTGLLLTAFLSGASAFAEDSSIVNSDNQAVNPGTSETTTTTVTRSRRAQPNIQSPGTAGSTDSNTDSLSSDSNMSPGPSMNDSSLHGQSQQPGTLDNESSVDQQAGTLGNQPSSDQDPSFDVNRNSRIDGNSGAMSTDNINTSQDDADIQRDDTTSMNQQPGAAGDRYEDSAVSSQASQRDVTQSGYLDRTIVGVQPQVGVIGFTDANGDTTTRGALGLTLDMNLASAISKDAGSFFIGPQTGLLYSHLGGTGSGFFGSGTATGGSNDANLLLIPANLKVGYAFLPNLRLSARGGGNVMYRSVGNSLDVGASSAALGTNSGWRIFPNVGGDLEIGFGPNVSLMLRPDVTITPGDDLYTGTVGLEIGLG